MFTATITNSIDNQFGGKDVSVSYTNGVKTYEGVLTGITDDTRLKVLIQEQVDFYNQSAQFQPTTGLVDLTPAPAATPPAPTQDEVDRQTFQDNLQTLRQVQRGIACGILDQGADADLLVTLKKLYVDKYLPLL